MSDSAGGTWPEQDAIELWLKKYNIDLAPKYTMELKKEVTIPRIKVQDELTKANQEIELLKAQMQAHLNAFGETSENSIKEIELLKGVVEAAKYYIKMTIGAKGSQDEFYNALANLNKQEVKDEG